MNATSPWWQTFFTGLIVEAQRRMYSEPQTREEAESLVQILSPAPGTRVLDVPCGNGRLALALAGRGLDVTGVDLTAELLEDARRAAGERHLTAVFERRDMRDLPWEATFDHAFCFGNSFGYFDEAGNREFLGAVHRILKPGGKFVLETHFVAESLFPQPLHRRWYELGDLYFLHETRYEPATARLTSTYTLIRNGETERKQAVYQVYTYRELLRVFQDAGFSRVECYGSLKREPFQLGSPGLWMVGTRA